MIRPATFEDIERLVEMGQRFAAETSYKDSIEVDPDAIRGTLENLLRSEDAAVLVSGSDATITGMIIVLTYTHVWSGKPIASELVWWVEPEARGAGVRLLRAAELWARCKGVEKMQMIAPNQKVGEFYQRLGYVPVETSFQRSL